MNLISSKTFSALGRTVNSIKTKQTTWSDGALCNCDKNSSGNASFISKNGSNLKSASSFSSQNTITNTCCTNISPCSINENKTKKKLLIIDIEDFESFDTIILEPKAQLLLSHFSLVFKDFYFKNKVFEKIKRQYAIRTGASLKNKQLSYPSKLKNYSNGLDPPQFLTQDFNFFEHKYFEISHSYCSEIKKHYPVKKIKLFKKPLPQMKIISHLDCELLGSDISLFGHMNFTKFLFFFENATQYSFVELPYKEKMKYILHDFSMENSHKEKRILFYPNEIKEIIIRRYLLLWQGVEILMNNGKSYFFNFFHSNHLQTFFSKIEKYFKITVITNLRENFAEQGFQKKWNNNTISSYEFLLAINKFASRSFIEPTQYPVFPWVLLEYKQMNSNNNTLHYRDFKYPVACQTEDKREECIQRYKYNIDNEFKSHLGTHYSTSSFIYYYLMRCNPYTHSLIKLQGDNFENTNRMFFSVDETLGILDSSPDCRELIPEFFSKIDFMINLNCNAFGKRRNGELVDDLLFDNRSSLSVYIDFIMRHRNLLDSSIVKTKLPHWINFIFGQNQLSGGEKACNIFQKETYEEKVNLEANIIELEKEKQDEAMIVKGTQDLITTITSFGMTPYKLLEKALVYEGNEAVDAIDDFPELLELKDNEKKLLQKECCYFSFDNKYFYILNKKKSTVEIEILPTKDMKVGKGKKIKDDHFQIYSLNGVKLFRKIKGEPLSSDGVISYYLYKPKYTFTTICNSSFLVSVRYKDNSISIQKIEQKTKEKPERILYDDFISAVTSNNDNLFFTGSLSGRLTEWQYDPIKRKCHVNKSIMAHKNKINAIELYTKYNIIATAGDDNYIYIRKVYNFELLVPIKINKKYIITYMKFSHFDFLYVMCYNKKKNMTRIFGYTLSGLRFAKSQYGHYNNFCFTKSGNLIVGNCNDEKEQLKIMRGSNLEIIKEKELIKDKNSKALGWFDFCMNDYVFFLGYKNKDFYIIEIFKEEDLESFK